jgi:hypothetical protein
VGLMKVAMPVPGAILPIRPIASASAVPCSHAW